MWNGDIMWHGIFIGSDIWHVDALCGMAIF